MSQCLSDPCPIDGKGGVVVARGFDLPSMSKTFDPWKSVDSPFAWWWWWQAPSLSHPSSYKHEHPSHHPRASSTNNIIYNTSLRTTLSTHLLGGGGEDEAEGQCCKPRHLHADVSICHQRHQDLLHLLSVGASISKAKAQDSSNPNGRVGVGDIVADEGKGGVVLVLRGEKERES